MIDTIIIEVINVVKNIFIRKILDTFLGHTKNLRDLFQFIVLDLLGLLDLGNGLLADPQFFRPRFPASYREAP